MSSRPSSTEERSTRCAPPFLPLSPTHRSFPLLSSPTVPSLPSSTRYHRQVRRLERAGRLRSFDRREHQGAHFLLATTDEAGRRDRRKPVAGGSASWTRRLSYHSDPLRCSKGASKLTSFGFAGYPRRVLDKPHARDSRSQGYCRCRTPSRCAPHRRCSSRLPHLLPLYLSFPSF